MKRKIYLYLTLLFSSLIFSAYGQMADPVKWKSHVEKISDTEYDLVFKADIEKGWHLYSQYNPEGASLPIEFFSEEAGKDFEFVGKAKESPTEKAFNKTFGKEEIFFSEKAMLKQRIKLLKKDIKTVKVTLYGQACQQSCIQLEQNFNFDLTQATTEIEPMPEASAHTDEHKAEKKTDEEKTDSISTEKKNENSFWVIFWLSFLGGLLALFTPCVFPLIPMTVSFFMKKSQNRAQGIKNALVYGISIVVIYVFIGTVFARVFGADAMNEFSTGAFFNLLFFVILLIFALSFLGAFEIMLPSSWGTKVDKQVDKKGGYIGIFFMALALAIVSFSCTLPIVGSALALSAGSGGMAPIISMLGFSIALALPFTLFAAFPGWLNSLPQSGGWLNTVKVVLGFIELAFAFKFLSNADLVYDMHWFERETFLAVWIAVFGTLSLYLFGKITLPHDDESSRISVGRLSLGLISLAFTVYMIPGLFGAPLKLISGFPPPLKYAESPYGVGYTHGGGGSTANVKIPEGAHLGPHDIITFDDYETGMAYAKKTGKPAMIDFTGKACVNCRKMEDYVWSNPEVMQILKNDLVLISLFVDYKKELPEDEQYVSEATGKKIRTVGNKWSEMQTVKYQSNTQPYYVMLNHDENKLTEAYTYDSDVEAFKKWLKKGIQKFKK